MVKPVGACGADKYYHKYYHKYCEGIREQRSAAN